MTGARTALGAMAGALACLAVAAPAWAGPCFEARDAVQDLMAAEPDRQTEAALFDRIAAACADEEDALPHAWFAMAIDLIYLKLPDGADLALDRYDAARIAEGRPRDFEIRARVAEARQDWRSAEALLIRAYQFYVDRPDIRSAHRAGLLRDRARMRLQMGDTAGARALAEEALAIGEAANGLRHASLWETVAFIGDTWAVEGDAERALARYEDALTYFRPDHQASTSSLRNRLAGAYLGAGRLEDAEAQARLAIQYGIYASNSRADRRRYRQTLAAILAAQGRGEEALAELAEASGSAQAAFALDGDVQDLLGVAGVLWQGRQYPFAALYYDQAYRILRDTLPPGAPSRATVAANAANAHLLGGSIHFALDRYREAAAEAEVLGRPPARQRNFRRGQVVALWVAAHL